MNIDEIITQLREKIEIDGNNEGSEINKLKSLLEGPPGPQGSPGKNVDPEEVTHRILIDPSKLARLSSDVANSDELRKVVAEKLKSDRTLRENLGYYLKHDQHFQQFVKGPEGPRGEKGNIGPKGDKGEPGLQGRKGDDAKPEDVAEKIFDDPTKLNTLNTEVASKLKSDNAFQGLARGPKGDQGPEGPRGEKGDIGPKGDKGDDAKPEDVAEKIFDDPTKLNTLNTEVASKLKSDNAFQGLARGPKGDQGPEGPRGEKGDIGPKGDKGDDAKPEDVAEKIFDDPTKLNTLNTEVASKLKSDNAFQGLARGPKGDQGPEGPKGQKGDIGPKGDKGDDAKPEDVAEKIFDDPTKLNTLNTEVASKLKFDNAFQGLARGPKGDQGPEGPKGQKGDIGPKGDKGDDAKPEDVAEKIFDDPTKLNTLNTEVASKLKSDNAFQGLARGPKGDQGPEGPRGEKGDIGPKGDKGDDAKPEDVAEKIFDDPTKLNTLNTEVASKLKSDNAFQGLARGPKGDQGPEGPKGQKGDIGPKGDKGDDAKPEDVAEKIFDDPTKLNTLNTEVASKLKSDNAFQGLARGPKGDQGPEGPRGEKGDIGPKGDKGDDAKPEDVAEKIFDDPTKLNTLNTEVASKLKSDNAFQGLARGPKGDQGPEGPKGQKGDIGPKGDKGDDAKPEDVAEKIFDDPTKLNTLNTEVASKLKSDNAFQGLARGPKGDQGPEGPRGEKGDIGPKGDKGDDAKPEDVAEKIFDDPTKLNTLNTEVASKLKSDSEFQRLAKSEYAKPEDIAKNIFDDINTLNTLSDKIASLPKLTGEVAKILKSDSTFNEYLKNLINSDHTFLKSVERKQGTPHVNNLKIVPSNFCDEENNCEAEIVLTHNDKNHAIAKFSKFGYFFNENELYIRNHSTGELILIPKEFHFLKVIQGTDGTYRLSFCNNHGNLLSEYKKYDPEYHQLIANKDYLIDVRHLKKEVSYFDKYYHVHTFAPIFTLKKGNIYHNGYYSADIYELETGKRIGTLIDECAYYQNKKLHYINYHDPEKSHHCDDSCSKEDHPLFVDFNEGNVTLKMNDHLYIHPIILQFDYDIIDFVI
ncbi:collagen-like protein [Wolbachia pipientis]|uniref:collagen-like protein n=1 Tax=Wolbachia pipientis TaxID=955 RepID=UPI0020B875F4|nr:collagen-like protein [Wolbachia pipientis]